MKLNPEKLHVEFRQGVTMTEPVVGRKYTLTHSDITAELFLTVGLRYAFDKVSAMRDEVLLEWRLYNGVPILYGYVHVDGQAGLAESAVRNAVFKREMPLALEAVRYGDGKFFVAHRELDSASIWIYFHSIYPAFNQLENWGTPKDYKVKA